MTAVREQIRVYVRWGIRLDVPQIMAIERASWDSPWTEAELLQCWRERNCICTVAEHGETIAGFMVYELGQDHLDILNFAVLPAWHRAGVGAQMIDKLKSKLRPHRRSRITATVRESNLGGQLFLRAQGFKAVRVLRGHFADTGEDAFVMEYSL